MPPVVVGGPRVWSGSRDDSGYRSWKLTYQTFSEDAADGPQQHMLTPGLPLPGSVYAVGNDIDSFAYCTGATDVSPREKDGKTLWYDHTFTFSSAPRGSGNGNGTGPNGSGGGQDDKGARKKCADQNIEDPLLEPPKTSGGTIRYTEEADTDFDGKPIRYTSFEQIRGPKAEFDRGRSQVVVELNVPFLDRATLDGYRDHVNDEPLWDLPARFWKFSEWTWDRKLYGVCFFYYTIRMVFESNVREYTDPETGIVVTASGWDKDVVDESSKCLNGEWDSTTGIWTDKQVGGQNPDSTNPAHYIDAFDRRGNTCRVMLSRQFPGRPAEAEDDVNTIFIKKYREKNLLNLGIPTVL